MYFYKGTNKYNNFLVIRKTTRKQ